MSDKKCDMCNMNLSCMKVSLIIGWPVKHGCEYSAIDADLCYSCAVKLGIEDDQILSLYRPSGFEYFKNLMRGKVGARSGSGQQSNERHGCAECKHAHRNEGPEVIFE